MYHRKICVRVCIDTTDGTALQRWLDVTLRPNPPSPLERILLPMRIPQFGASETELRPELAEQDLSLIHI